jgi:hypothetical protein
MPRFPIEHNFTYHAPKPGQPEQYQALREMAKQLAFAIDTCPESREKSLAFTKLEESIFWANASIARHGTEADAPTA